MRHRAFSPTTCLVATSSSACVFPPNPGTCLDSPLFLRPLWWSPGAPAPEHMATRLVTVDPFGATAAIWDAHSGRVLHTLRHDAKAKHALFDAQVFPGGDRVATLCSDGSVTIWSASTGKLLQRSNVAGASAGLCGQGRRVLRAVPRSRWPTISTLR